MTTLTVPLPNMPAAKRALVKIFGLLAIFYICYLVREIWLPLSLAFLLAMVLDPIVDRMESRGWGRTWASVFIFGSFLIITIGLAVLASPFVASQVSTLQIGFQKYFPDSSHTGLLRSFRHMGLSTSMANAAASGVDEAKLSVQHSSNGITNFGMSMASNAIWIVIVPIVAFYALRDFHVILAKSLLLVPARRRDLVQTAVSEITSIFGKYLRGLLIVSVLNGLATATLLSVLHVQGALILGVIAGLLYSVPYVGALITIVITAAVAFVGGGPNLMFLSVGLSVLLHQIIFDQIVTPRILGNQVGLHPILSIVALMAGNLLLGIIGMILAVPVAACLQIAVLAMLPKLSEEIEIHNQHEGNGDTVTSLEKETKEEHQKMGGDIHSAVTTAVAAIVAASNRSDLEEQPPAQEDSLQTYS